MEQKYFRYSCKEVASVEHQRAQFTFTRSRIVYKRHNFEDPFALHCVYQLVIIKDVGDVEERYELRNTETASTIRVLYMIDILHLIYQHICADSHNTLDPTPIFNSVFQEIYRPCLIESYTSTPFVVIHLLRQEHLRQVSPSQTIHAQLPIHPVCHKQISVTSYPV